MKLGVDGSVTYPPKKLSVQNSHKYKTSENAKRCAMQSNAET